VSWVVPGVHTEEATGSIPGSPTNVFAGEARFCPWMTSLRARPVPDARLPVTRRPAEPVDPIGPPGADERVASRENVTPGPAGAVRG
jgi:hypothetical protein